MLTLTTCGSLFAQSVVTLPDFGKTDGLGYYVDYLIHFRIDDPDNAYGLDSVYIEFNGYDTFIRENATGEYRYELWIHRDTTYMLSIGNAPYQGKDHYWKSGDAWSGVRTVSPPSAPERPLNVILPYSEPTLAQLLEWSQMTYVDHQTEMRKLGLEPRKTSEDDKSLWTANGYDFNFTYHIERFESNFMTITYGVYNSDYPSELDWAKDITMRLKEKMKDYYKGKRTMGDHDLDSYKFTYQGASYAMHLLEDPECIIASYENCYKTIVYLKWE